MSSRRGFTLMEVLLALTIGGLVVLMADWAFGAAVDTSQAIDRSRSANDEIMVTRRTLAAWLGSVDAASPGSAGFHGIPSGLVFSAWRGSVLTRAQVRIAGGRIELRTLRDTLRLMRADRFAADYLLSYGADAAWVQEWESPASAPLAVRLRIARADSASQIDTLLLVIGPRG